MQELKTKTKITFARCIRSVVKPVRLAFGGGDKIITRRSGILWNLDLKEGIDFSIYIFGGFELRTLRLYKKIVRNGNIVIDVGANIGAHTLPLAQLVGQLGRVFAFEPTEYAFKKLEHNLSLNPELASRVFAKQVALLESTSASVPDEIYSSWPIERSGDVHLVHGGQLKGTQGAHSTTATKCATNQGMHKKEMRHVPSFIMPPVTMDKTV